MDVDRFHADVLITLTILLIIVLSVAFAGLPLLQ